MLESSTEINTVDKTNINKADISKLALIKEQNEKSQFGKLRPWLQPGADVTARHNLCSPREHSWCAAKPTATRAVKMDLFLQVLRKHLDCCVLGTQLYVTVNHLEQVTVCQRDAAQPQFSRSLHWVGEMLMSILDELNWGIAVVPSLNLATVLKLSLMQLDLVILFLVKFSLYVTGNPLLCCQSWFLPMWIS